MACRNAGMEWVETTEEVVITEECLSPEDNPPAELEPAETPIQKLLDTVGPGDVPEADGGFYCEECLTLFQDHSDPANIHGPSFILDFPSSTGVPQRALLTLPYGLMIGRSSIPGAGVGVINQETVSPGMHFGPFEGEVTTRENAVASCASWEIYKDDGEYEYIDAATESHSNWMRYINCARSKDETNLLAVQYKGSILYHCCRAIRPGDELLVWPGAAFLGRFSEAWTEAWLAKLNARGNSDGAETQVFVCSRCQLTFTTESFLQRHAENFHAPPEGDNATPANTESVESRTCSDCGKTFKQIPHLKRHRLCVHSNKRPYCCPHCRRSFSQASGLIRHQLVHRKRAVRKDTEAVATQEESVSEEKDESSENVAAATDESTNVEEETERTCSDCSKNFKNEASLKKHKVMVHERLRPYVCTVCQKCFGQCNDLTRHLRLHKKQNQGAKKALEESTAMPFSCGECSLSVSSVDALQQHIAEHHSQEDAAAGNQEDVDEDQSHDPDFSPPALGAETAESTQKRERPQRRGAGSKISAITKLIAPKRRAVVFTKPASDAERSSADPEGSRKLTKYKWFSCNRCKRTYGNPDDLKTHKCALKPLKCAQCGATFTKSGFLKRHEQMAHGNAKSYSCDRCGKVFTTSGNLKQHQKSNACTKYYCTEELHACPFCQFSFTMKSYLTKHVKRHHPVEYLSHRDTASLAERLEEDEEEDEAGKKYDCPHCGKSCESAKAFKSHTCFQQVKVLYLCTDCGKGFTNHYGLKQHQRVHTGEKPYVCPHCGKRFSYTGQLNVHLRTHTGEKPYLCTHCGESFRQSGDLKRHERKHTGVRPYSCPECCKSFSRPQSLKAHQMLHLGQRMFKCNQCGKSFSRNYHLRRHHQKMHL